MCSATASTKTQSQQKASSIGIGILANKGYVKAIPEEYKIFQNCKSLPK